MKNSQVVTSINVDGEDVEIQGFHEDNDKYYTKDFDPDKVVASEERYQKRLKQFEQHNVELVGWFAYDGTLAVLQQTTAEVAGMLVKYAIEEYPMLMQRIINFTRTEEDRVVTPSEDIKYAHTWVKVTANFVSPELDGLTSFTLYKRAVGGNE